MRIITEQSTTAFLNRRKFKKANTEVIESGGKFYLRLHGNTIAILDPDNTLMITNAGWQSNTTKERLNGLDGVSIQQKNFAWFLNGNEWDGNLIEVKLKK